MTVKAECRTPPSGQLATAATVRVLIVVEGRNDIEFLRRISQMLHQNDGDVPDLRTMERRGELIFFPLGGGSIAASPARLAPLRLNEFHLYDRELPPETELRRAAVEQINRRDCCRAFLTGKRSLENYLHPDAIQRTGGARIEFGDFDSPPDLLAKTNYRDSHPTTPWELLPYRARKRFANRAKRWLNRCAVECMTPKLLAERDQDDEVLFWLRTIAQMADGTA